MAISTIEHQAYWHKSAYKQVSLILVLFLVIAATMNAQGLKTYSGFYKGIRLTIGTQKATYTYKDAEDGTRIYEGNFTYTCVIKPNIYDKVTGRFHNDCKEGLWTFTNMCGEPEVLKINYKGGYRNGIYEYTCKTRKGTIKKSFKATMKDGLPIGAFSGRSLSGPFTGQTDENGLQDGVWKFTMGYSSKDYYYEKWEHGVLKECYYIDDSTGDKIECKERIWNEIHSVIQYVAEMENWISRGSDRVWEGEFAQPKNNKDNEEGIEKPLIEEEQTLPEVEDYNIYEVVEEMPSFPGGQGAMMQFLSSNLQYPEEARLGGLQGRVIVGFIVERDGSISNVKISRSVAPSLDSEAIRLAKSMPKWKPGKSDGHTVRVKYTIPIVFRVQ